MNHVVLLGDSILDNARYVPAGTSVMDHLRRCLPGAWRATLLAVDGLVAVDVSRQLNRLPSETTHLVISAGGNNALDHSSLILQESATSFAEVLSHMARIRDTFEHEYTSMIDTVLARNLPTLVCTIYDSIPDLTRAELAGLCLFNDVILRTAFRLHVSVLDLRSLCVDGSDYATTSPIEPSATGGGKIARGITRVLLHHDFSVPENCVYT